MSNADTVGSLLATIATSLQDAHRILMFADKRGWGTDEFEQVRAVEEALDEAKRDFQTLGPLVNGQFYYENDRRAESLKELRLLRTKFDNHTQNFKDWLRIGGHINAIWVHETIDLRRQLHRAQCRAARRIFNAEREDGGSGGRCLGAFLVYRRWREAEDRRAQEKRQAATQSSALGAQSGQARAHVPAWKAQQSRIHTREALQFMGREQLTRRRTGSPEYESVEMTTPHSTRSSHQQTPATSSSATPTNGTGSNSAFSATTSSCGMPITLEDLVPDCNAIGSFERFGDDDIAFICDYCDGHIVWEDVQRLPSSRLPPPGISSSSVPGPYASSSSSFSSLATPLAAPNGSQQPPSSRPTLSLVTPNDAIAPPRLQPASTPMPQPLLLASQLQSQLHPQLQLGQSSPGLPSGVPEDNNGYPRWQATTVAASSHGKPQTVVFAPLAIANHLPPMGSDWEARLWCPYCDDYLYFDQSEGDQTKYAQDEYGFSSLADFQEHLEWYHTAMPMPSLPTGGKNCQVM